MELGRYLEEQGISVILASGSPRRTELLSRAGIAHEVVPSGAEENAVKTDPAGLVEELSAMKAEEVAHRLFGRGQEKAEGAAAGLQKRQRGRASQLTGQAAGAAAERDGNGFGGLPVTGEAVEKDGNGFGGFVVIGADTVVAKDGKILGKPKDRAEASAMLHLLSGSVHQVYTGVTIIANLGNPGEGPSQEGSRAAVDPAQGYRVRTFFERSDVHVAALEDDEIEAYIATGEPMDKAGAYGIQGRFGKYISRIEGDYYNIVGLPVCRLCSELKRMLEAKERFSQGSPASAG